MAVATASMLAGAHAESCASAFSGFYAGVQAGLANTTGNLTVSDYYGNTEYDTATSTHKGSTGKKSFLGGLFVGYGMGVGSCAYVGGELYANFGKTSANLYDSSSASDYNKNYVIKMQRNFNFGAKVRLGYTVSQQAMVFLGLGLEYAKIQLKSENIAVVSQSKVSTTTTSKSKNKLSFAPSVGMDIFLNKNLFLRGEYTYVVGINQKINPQIKSFQKTNPATSTVKVNSTQQRFTLGLGYKF